MRRGRGMVAAAAGSRSAPDSDPMSPASPNTPPPLLLPRNPGAVVRRDSDPMLSMVVRRRTGSVISPGRDAPPPPPRSVGVSAAPAVISKSNAVLI
jgi:hypothetical protein